MSPLADAPYAGLVPEPEIPETPVTPEDAAAPAARRQCAWCATPAHDGDTNCVSCGAALAQREGIGDLQIPGLTSVDPALEDYDKRPLHLKGPSSAQGVAPALIVGAMAGGPIGLVAIGGVAAVAGVEFMAANRGKGGTANLDEVGKPSEVLLQALDNLPADDSVEEAAKAKKDEEPDHAADDGGKSIWRDLPPSAAGDEETKDEGGSQGGW